MILFLFCFIRNGLYIVVKNKAMLRRNTKIRQITYNNRLKSIQYTHLLCFFCIFAF